jgi:hypothetical protein
MVIAKGEAWGRSGPMPENAPWVENDAALARLVSEHDHPVAGVLDGDLVRTLGGPRGDAFDLMWFPMDVGWVRIGDQQEIPFVAHVIARRRWWHGEWAAVMNAAWLGDLYLGPRAHPNDGLFDVTVGSLPPRQRIQARGRARQGMHLPHPLLTTHRVATWHHDFDKPVRVWVDGVDRGKTGSIAVRVEPDACTVVH